MITTPRNLKYRSIPARALSGQVYKGAVFWDTEMFMLPYFLLVDQNICRDLLLYRIDGLLGAKEKAKEFGFQGAFYAWESTLHGIDECSLYNMSDAITKKPVRTYFKDKQIHISVDIAYAIKKYLQYTSDTNILFEGAIEVLIEIIRFYYTYGIIDKNMIMNLNDVTGPDEYHERINNNAYTNYLVMDLFNDIESIIILANELDKTKTDEIMKRINGYEILEQIKQVTIKKPLIKNKVIEQFNDYFLLEDIKLEELLSKKKNKNEYLGGEKGLATKTQIIKQADVVTMLYLLHHQFTKEELQANFDYYLPRTEHGSTLSQSMYALVACLLAKPDIAWKYFVASANIDLYPVAKEYAGGIYIGGTHPASAGGALMSVLYGFAGTKLKDNELTFKNNLPANINKLHFKVQHQHDCYDVTIQTGLPPKIEKRLENE